LESKNAGKEEQYVVRDLGIFRKCLGLDGALMRILVPFDYKAAILIHKPPRLLFPELLVNKMNKF